MKIHVIGSISGNQERYKEIIKCIEVNGDTVITNHYSLRTLEEVAQETPADTESYRKKSLEWIKQADIIIFEATKPSFGTGYKLAVAIDLKKPIIIIYEPNVSNAPLHSLFYYNERIQVVGYTLSELPLILKDAIDIAIKYIEVRFTLILPGDIISYLDDVAQNGKNRSEFIRDLIRREMRKNDT